MKNLFLIFLISMFYNSLAFGGNSGGFGFPKPTASIALKQQRTYHKKSIRDVAKKLGSSSPTTYSRYENGSVKLNFDKFTKILMAIEKNNEPILKIG